MSSISIHDDGDEVNVEVYLDKSYTISEYFSAPPKKSFFGPGIDGGYVFMYSCHNNTCQLLTGEENPKKVTPEKVSRLVAYAVNPSFVGSQFAQIRYIPFLMMLVSIGWYLLYFIFPEVLSYKLQKKRLLTSSHRVKQMIVLLIAFLGVYNVFMSGYLYNAGILVKSSSDILIFIGIETMVFALLIREFFKWLKE